ncbi:MAG: hypothetical protein GY914_01285 [Prochlorococcus sp.]|nr:hypothetical protein [Prochlorococcus sp.]
MHTEHAGAGLRLHCVGHGVGRAVRVCGQSGYLSGGSRCRVLGKRVSVAVGVRGRTDIELVSVGHSDCQRGRAVGVVGRAVVD